MRTAFSRGQGQSVLVAVQRRKRWSCGARNAYRMFRPLGAQLVQLDRSRSRTCTEPSAPGPSGKIRNGGMRTAFSRGQGQSVLVAVQRRKRWSCGARNAYRMFRPLGAQLVQLDRSRSRTCTEPSAPGPSGKIRNGGMRTAFSRGQGQSVLVAVQRRKRWSCGARNIHQSGICWLRQCSAPPSRMMSKQSMVSTFRLGNAAPIRSQARASRRSSR